MYLPRGSAWFPGARGQVDHLCVGCQREQDKPRRWFLGDIALAVSKSAKYGDKVVDKLAGETRTTTSRLPSGRPAGTTSSQAGVRPA
jgi:hypothetical protein